jgi:hypothetical protein
MAERTARAFDPDQFHNKRCVDGSAMVLALSLVLN